MNIKKYIVTAIAVVASVFNFDVAAWTSEKYKIDEMEVKVEHGLLKVDMNVRPSKYHVSYNKQLVLTPVVRAIGSNDTVALPTVVIAGRNAYYNTERGGKFDGVLLRAGHSGNYAYSTSTEWQPWMEHCRLDLIAHTTGCCGSPSGEEPDMPVAILDFRPITFSPLFHYDVPTPEKVKERRIEGRANVNFVVNITKINPSYMENPVELRKITNSIDSVRLNPDATVKSITLTGYASPEGPYNNNVRLAKGRTESVTEYVRGLYTFPADVFHTNYVPEDWEGLRDSIEHSILPDKMKMLDFIDNVKVKPERRNDEFAKRFPASYKYLLKNIYPWLRHTNYAIDYEIKSYTDIDEIRRVLAERPGNLSLNEFFLAANSYPAGSKEYDQVFETAVLYHPTDTIANLNAANSAMNEGDYRRARMYLDRVSGNPSATYALAILDALQGNYDAAEKGFETAKANGYKEAEDALEQIARIKKRQINIKYIPEGSNE